MTFDYFQTTLFNASIDIEDVGNCAIRVCTDLGEESFLIIDTQQGTTRIFQYGPIVVDVQLLPKSVSCTFERIQYDILKIRKKINCFLNPPRNVAITQAFEISKEEALKCCRSLIEYMKQDILY